VGEKAFGDPAQVWLIRNTAKDRALIAPCVSVADTVGVQVVIDEVPHGRADTDRHRLTGIH
jgi:hypothetical protein